MLRAPFWFINLRRVEEQGFLRGADYLQDQGVATQAMLEKEEQLWKFGAQGLGLSYRSLAQLGLRCLGPVKSRSEP